MIKTQPHVERDASSDAYAYSLPAGHAWLYSDYVRTGTMSTLLESVEAAAVKLAKRIAGVTAHVFADTLEDGAPWCATHRTFYCGEGSNPFAVETCEVTRQAATRVTVSATGLPVFDGVWSVAGVLRVDSEGVVTAHTVGASADGFATAHTALAGTCAHCGTERRRSLTVLLVDDEGTVRPVGRSCLAEYTGGMIRAELVGDLLSVGERMRQAFGVAQTADPDSAPVLDVVAVARILVDRHGFIPTSSYGRDIPTAVLLADCIAPRGNKRGEVSPAELTDAERDAARADIAAILATSDRGEYMSNLAAVVSVEWTQITGRGHKLGILASLPRAADRARRESAPAPVETPADAHLGSIGDKLTVSGTVAAVSAFEGQYGTRWLVKLETPAGAVKMFTTARAIVELEAGASVTIVGTVKSHDVWQGTRETTLVRPKLVA